MTKKECLEGLAQKWNRVGALEKRNMLIMFGQVTNCEPKTTSSAAVWYTYISLSYSLFVCYENYVYPLALICGSRLSRI